MGLVQRALQSGRFGSYTLQAAIAAVHATSSLIDATDWAQIVRLYDMLLEEVPFTGRGAQQGDCGGDARRTEAGLVLVDALPTAGARGLSSRSCRAGGPQSKARAHV